MAAPAPDGLPASAAAFFDGPHPDIHALFNLYASLYFDGDLGPTSVEWSTPRMTACAGVCVYDPGGGVAVRLSAPLLALRPASDALNTLLHEMIHAEARVRRWPAADAGRDGHGPRFLARAAEINASRVPDPVRPHGGYRITVRHTFVDEVRSFQTHGWRCARCGHEIFRAMDRPPQPADCVRKGRHGGCDGAGCGYHAHVRACGGRYEKVAAPSAAPPRRRPGRPPRPVDPRQATLDAFAGRGRVLGRREAPAAAAAEVVVLSSDSD